MSSRTTTSDPADAKPVVHLPAFDPANDPYVAANERLVEAKANVRHWASVADQDPHRRLIGELSRGDLSITPMDLLKATAETEHAKAVTRFYEAEASRLDRIGPFEPTSAKAVAEVIAEKFGVPVYVVDKIPTEHPSEPTAYVRQDARTKRDLIFGSISCSSITVVYRRSDLHKSASWKPLEAALKKAGVQCQVASRGSGPGEDRAEIVVERAWPEVFVLDDRKPNDFMGKQFLERLAWACIVRVGQETYMPMNMRGEAVTGYPVRVGACKATVSRTRKGSELITEVTGTLRIVPSDDFSALHPKTVISAITDTAANYAGTPAEGLGTVTSLKVTPKQTNDSAVVYTVKATLNAEVAAE